MNLPSQGNYSVTAIAFDTSGQQDPSSTGATSQYPIYPGDLPPTVTEALLQPTDGTVFTDGHILVSGRLEDDQQIAQAQVAIRNGLGQYMSSTGTFTSTTVSYRTAFLTSPGSPGSNFSYTTPVVPSGAYTILVRGVDQHGFITPVPSQRSVTVTGTRDQPATGGELHVQLRAERLFVRRALLDRREPLDAHVLVELRQRIGHRTGADPHVHRPGHVHRDPDRA